MVFEPADEYVQGFIKTIGEITVVFGSLPAKIIGRDSKT